MQNNAPRTPNANQGINTPFRNDKVNAPKVNSSAINTLLPKNVVAPANGSHTLCQGLQVRFDFINKEFVELELLSNDVAVRGKNIANIKNKSITDIKSVKMNVAHYNPVAAVTTVTGTFLYYNGEVNTPKTRRLTGVPKDAFDLWNLCAAAILCYENQLAQKYIEEVYPRIAALLVTRPSFMKRSTELCRLNGAPQAPAVTVTNTANVEMKAVALRVKKPSEYAKLVDIPFEGLGATHPELSAYNINEALNSILYNQGAYQASGKLGGQVYANANEAITILVKAFKQEQHNALITFLASKGVTVDRDTGIYYVYEPPSEKALQVDVEAQQLANLLASWGLEGLEGGKNKNATARGKKSRVTPRRK